MTEKELREKIENLKFGEALESELYEKKIKTLRTLTNILEFELDINEKQCSDEECLKEQYRELLYQCVWYVMIGGYEISSFRDSIDDLEPEIKIGSSKDEESYSDELESMMDTIIHEDLKFFGDVIMFSFLSLIAYSDCDDFKKELLTLIQDWE